MKFINYLESITGISIFPLAALLIFTSVFLIATIAVIKTDNETIQRHKNVPLDN